MQFPVIFLSIVAAVSAAPQLFFVVPPQFIETKTQQELNSFIPVVVPIENDQSIAASVKQETLIQGSEPVPEVAAEVQPSEVSNTPVVASEGAEESLPVADVQEEVAQDQAAPQSETEMTTDPSPADQAQEIRAEETTEPQPSVANAAEPEPSVADAVEAEPSVVDAAEPELSLVDAVEPNPSVVDAVEPVPSVVDAAEPETATEAAPQQEEVILPETTLNIADTPSEVVTNEIVAQESTKPEETPKSDPSSGKSINSHNVIPSTTLITHFGYNPNTIVRSHQNTITSQGTIVDPRTLVPAEFRHFIYENDAPEVIAAKVAFFRVQAALTPRKRL